MSVRACACALLTAVAISVASRPVFAQGSGAITVAGGYSSLREVATGAAPAYDYSGFFASGARQLGSSRVEVAGEINSHSRKNILGETQRLYGFLGGARIRLAAMSRLLIFAHALAGMERFSEPGFSEKGFAFQPGGGVDVAIWDELGVRVQSDFRIAREGGTTFKELLLGAGVVVRFGAQ